MPPSPTLARQLPVHFRAGTGTAGRLDDVTEAIRSEEGGMNASRVSTMPAVRAALVRPAAGLFKRCPAWWPTGATWAP
jgi:3-phosphoshikimate 1-carboxyvinyltransferase